MQDSEVPTAGGRVLHAFDTGPLNGGDDADTLALLWCHGSPQTGALLPPVVEAAAHRGIRMFSYARPSYGGSSHQRGRRVSDAATDTMAVADAFGIDRFAVMGASGGGPHALAAAALYGDRVRGVVTLAGIAPFTDEFDWFQGMASPDGICSAFAGREQRAAFEEHAQFDSAQFVAADFAALEGSWSSLAEDVGRSAEHGPDGLIDDDVAFASAWGFALASITAPVLVVQGQLDRVVPPAHGEWLAEHIPSAEQWRRPDDGHVSVLNAAPAAMDWLLAR